MEMTVKRYTDGQGSTLVNPKLVPADVLHNDTLTLEPAILPVEQAPEQFPTPAPKSPRQRPVRLLLALAGLGAIAAGVTGYRWWQFASTHQETDNAAVSAHVYQINSRIVGSVINVPVDDNQTVQVGELLVRLDPKDYQVKVQQALAALAIAQRQAQAAQTGVTLAGGTAQAQTTEAQGELQQAIAAISSARSAVTESQAGVPAAQAQVAQTQATLQKAQADYSRYQSLYQSGAISRQQLDSAKAAYDVALAQQQVAQQGVRQAQAQLAQAQNGIAAAQAGLAASRGGVQKAQMGNVQTAVTRSQYDAAQATIAQAQANLAEAQLQLSYTNLSAPVAGRIGRKSVEVGEQVQPGQALMAVVGNDVWVVANFKETQLAEIQPGEPVEITLDAFPDHTFTGKVSSLSPASGSEFALLPPDNATGNFTKIVQRVPVKITFDSSSIQGYESRISPGMSASVSVDVQ